MDTQDERKSRRDDCEDRNRSRSRSQSPTDERKPNMAKFLEKMIKQNKEKKEKVKDRGTSNLNPNKKVDDMSDALKKLK